MEGIQKSNKNQYINQKNNQRLLNLQLVFHKFLKINLNQDTPKYKAVKLVFSEVMEEYYSNSNNPVSLKRTNPMHMPTGDEELDPRTLVRFQNNPSIRNDGNDVNMDYEMSQQAEAELRYKLLSQIAGKKVTGLVDLTKTQAQ